MRVNINDALTSGAILVALITWWTTYHREHRSEKAARTAEVIANLSTSEPLAEAVYQVTKLINAGRRVHYDDIDESTERYVVTVLDYYEYMCELYQSGVLSKATITNLRGRLMVRTYDICEDYIAGTRQRQGRLVYEALERFVIGFPGREASVPADPGTT